MEHEACQKCPVTRGGCQDRPEVFWESCWCVKGNEQTSVEGLWWTATPELESETRHSRAFSREAALWKASERPGWAGWMGTVCSRALCHSAMCSWHLPSPPQVTPAAGCGSSSLWGCCWLPALHGAVAPQVSVLLRDGLHPFPVTASAFPAPLLVRGSGWNRSH